MRVVELVDLGAVEQQLPVALGHVVELDAARLPGCDVHADQPRLPAFDAREGLLEVDLARAQILMELVIELEDGVTGVGVDVGKHG